MNDIKGWVLVAGTALHHGVPKPAIWAAEEVGNILAEHDFGLVTGGWHGVDYIAARAFAERLSRLGIGADQRLIQVIREDLPVLFEVGRIERTRRGASEWLGPQNYSNAVVLIGGLGGAYGSFLGALHKGLPRFPLAGTGGDAEGAFRQMVELWDLIPNPGITRSQFETLGAPIATNEDARHIARKLVPPISASIAASDKRNSAQDRKISQIFISYSNEDVVWLERLRKILRPLERTELVDVWSDLNIEFGIEWEPEILRKLRSCNIAVLLVSANFLASDYVNNVELPILIKRAELGEVRLLWLLVAPALWEQSGLTRFQAVAGTKRSLTQMADAEAQVTLVELARSIVEISKLSG